MCGSFCEISRTGFNYSATKPQPVSRRKHTHDMASGVILPVCACTPIICVVLSIVLSAVH